MGCPVGWDTTIEAILMFEAVSWRQPLSMVDLEVTECVVIIAESSFVSSRDFFFMADGKVHEYFEFWCEADVDKGTTENGDTLFGKESVLT